MAVRECSSRAAFQFLRSALAPSLAKRELYAKVISTPASAFEKCIAPCWIFAEHKLESVRERSCALFTTFCSAFYSRSLRLIIFTGCGAVEIGRRASRNDSASMMPRSNRQSPIVTSFGPMRSVSGKLMHARI